MTAEIRTFEEEDSEQYLNIEKPQMDDLREKIGLYYDLLNEKDRPLPLHPELEEKPLRSELIKLLFSLAEHYEFHHHELEECYSKIIELDSENIHAYIKLGDVYNYNNALDKAIKCYEKVLEITKNKIKEIRK